MDSQLKYITAAEAAEYVKNGYCIGIGGFASTGVPKAVPLEIAQLAEREHAAGRPFSLKLISGASAGVNTDTALARANAIEYRIPYQSTEALRQQINAGKVQYVDMHLSQIAQDIRFQQLPSIDIAIIEAAAVTETGEITLTTSSGNAPLFCQQAKKIIVELNEYHSPRLAEIHDVYLPIKANEKKPVDVDSVSTRIGTGTISVNPEKIIGVVKTNASDALPPFKSNTAITDAIGKKVVDFLEKEYLTTSVYGDFPPIQSGIGNIANSVLSCLAESSIIPPISIYTEVAQDAAVKLLKEKRCKFISASSLTLTDEMLDEIYNNFDFYKDKLLIRPQEVSNSPGICRQLGIISINTALEMDIFGNVNSSHLFGTHIMNGIGGSGDFARNANISIFVCPSTTKNGKISAIVPMVSHTDHTEHDVKLLITEYGIADLRGKSPRERAELIIECAHPSYRELLKKYVSLQKEGHIPHTLEKAFAFHTAYKNTGDMHNALI